MIDDSGVSFITVFLSGTIMVSDYIHIQKESVMMRWMLIEYSLAILRAKLGIYHNSSISLVPSPLDF